MTIAVVTLGALFLMGMTVYRDIDISIYTSMPDAFLSLFGIPADADIASLAYGAIYTGYALAIGGQPAPLAIVAPI
jgi:hypothetical protein